MDMFVDADTDSQRLLQTKPMLAEVLAKHNKLWLQAVAASCGCKLRLQAVTLLAHKVGCTHGHHPQDPPDPSSSIHLDWSNLVSVLPPLLVQSTDRGHIFFVFLCVPFYLCGYT